MDASEEYKNYLEQIKYHLEVSLTLAEKMQEKVQGNEGDSDLYRKLAFYLRPNLHHWIHGTQAGGIKDLNTLLLDRDNAKK